MAAVVEFESWTLPKTQRTQELSQVVSVHQGIAKAFSNTNATFNISNSLNKVIVIDVES